MFAHQRTTGFASIVAVAVVMLAAVAGTGVLVKVYREGGGSQLPANTSCQVVCSGTPARG